MADISEKTSGSNAREWWHKAYAAIAGMKQRGTLLEKRWERRRSPWSFLFVAGGTSGKERGAERKRAGEKKPYPAAVFTCGKAKKWGPGAGKDGFRSGEATRPGTGEAQITGNRVVGGKQSAAGGGKPRRWQKGSEGEETWFSWPHGDLHR